MLLSAKPLTYSLQYLGNNGASASGAQFTPQTIPITSSNSTATPNGGMSVSGNDVIGIPGMLYLVTVQIYTTSNAVSAGQSFSCFIANSSNSSIGAGSGATISAAAGTYSVNVTGTFFVTCPSDGIMRIRGNHGQAGGTFTYNLINACFRGIA